MSAESWITLASAIGNATVIATMLGKGLWRKLPVFLIYMIWSLIFDCAAFYFLMHAVSHDFYLNFYRVMETGDSLLIFVVMVELAWSTLNPVRSQLPKGSLFVLVGLLAVIGLVAWPVASIAIPPTVGGVGVSVFRLSAVFAVLRVIFFLIMAGFSQILAISFRDRELQVATGMGFYSIVSLLFLLFSSHQANRQLIQWFSFAVSISYVGALGYWVLSFLAKDYERKEFSPQMQQFLVYMGGNARAGSIALGKIPPDHIRTRDN